MDLRIFLGALAALLLLARGIVEYRDGTGWPMVVAGLLVGAAVLVRLFVFRK